MKNFRSTDLSLNFEVIKIYSVLYGSSINEVTQKLFSNPKNSNKFYKSVSTFMDDFLEDNLVEVTYIEQDFYMTVCFDMINQLVLVYP